MLVAVAFMVISISSCGTKSSSDSSATAADEFVEDLDNITEKTKSVETEAQYEAIEQKLRDTLAKYIDNDSKLQKEEKKVIINAIIDFSVVLSSKLEELNGHPIDTEYKRQLRTSLESFYGSDSKDCNSIREIIFAIFPEIANGLDADNSVKSSVNSSFDESYEKPYVKDAYDFVRAINSATAKINAASDEQEFEAAGKSLEDTFDVFTGNDKELSYDEKSQIVDALADLIAVTGCKQLELKGEPIDTDTPALVKSHSKTMVEDIIKDCKSINDIIEAIAKLS